MSLKVLLADDSPTIQKVVKITLANQPYEIVEASSEDELFLKLSSGFAQLVLLDFNLSEKFSGYDLTAKIKQISPNSKVLLMLGTFDHVEDSALEKCGASDKIVKPFDSNKFISLCQKLINSSSLGSSSSLELIEEDQWKMSNAKVPPVREQEFPLLNKDDDKNNLEREVEDWGMSIPGKINVPEKQQQALPPVIGGESENNIVRLTNLEKRKPVEVKFPTDQDLDYPTLEQPYIEQNTSTMSHKENQYISLDSFNQPIQEFEIEGAYVPYETDIRSLEEQIKDEVEQNLWKIDGDFESNKGSKNQMGSDKSADSNLDKELLNFNSTSSPVDWTGIDIMINPEIYGLKFNAESGENAPKESTPEPETAMVRDELDVIIKKYVKEYLDEMFLKSTEKVAWEVIPDLAENIIRQEISKISNKILDRN